MNANRTPLWAGLAALTMTVAWAGSAPAQSNATDTTFFPMHQGNRWIFERIESTNPVIVSNTIFEFKNPVIEQDGILSMAYDVRMPPYLAFTDLLCSGMPQCHESVWVDYSVAEGRIYLRRDEQKVTILDFRLAESDSMVVVHPMDPTWRMVQRVTERITVEKDGHMVDQVYIEAEVFSDDPFQPQTTRYYHFERGLGELNGYRCSFECSSTFVPALVAARINGQVLFGDITVSDGGDQADVPEGFHLEPAYPNPFNPATTLRFALDRSGDVALEVYDMLGRRVLAAELGAMQAGEHRRTLDLSGRPSGTYLVRLRAGGQARTTRVTLLK